MDKIKITGQRSLNGSVKISGSKNAALPILMACLLAETPVTLSNVPHLKDVTTSLQLLASMGVEVLFDEKLNIELDANKVESKEPCPDLVQIMRASILAIGPLLARFGEAKIALPGGCAIGMRPVDIHIAGFEQMGAQFICQDDCLIASAKKLHGATIKMNSVTVTGTENLLMAAVLANGTTVLENAAMEPEVSDLANFLNKMGAKITGIGTNTLTIEGVVALKGCEYTIIPDRIEAGTYLAAAAVTQSCITVKNVEPLHLKVVLDKFREANAKIDITENSITLDMRNRKLIPVNIKTQAYPEFPTDMQAQFMIMNIIADGKSIIEETIFENRFMHVKELIKMGANIKLDGNTAHINGVKSLNAATVTATDLRASACLILAGLVAYGQTTVECIHHIDRGYELIEEKFHKLGAEVLRA